MAKFVIEIADDDIEQVEYAIALGSYEIIERVDDEYQTRVCHCDTDCCSD